MGLIIINISGKLNSKLIMIICGIGILSNSVISNLFIVVDGVLMDDILYLNI